MNKKNDVECAEFCSDLARSILSCNAQSSKYFQDITSIVKPISLSYLYNYIVSNKAILLRDVERVEIYTEAALSFLLNILSPYKQIHINEDSKLYNKGTFIIRELSREQNQEIIRILLMSILLQNNNFLLFPVKFDHRRILLCAEMWLRIQYGISELRNVANTNTIRDFLCHFRFFITRTFLDELTFPQVEIVLFLNYCNLTLTKRLIYICFVRFRIGSHPELDLWFKI